MTHWRQAPDIPRFMRRVDKTGTCWLWTGYSYTNGYGYFEVEPGKFKTAHRVAYTLFRGEVPQGFHVHHLCKTPMCVNPEHLEALPAGEHSKRHHPRRSHCKHGHVFDEANTYVGKDGRRACRACHRLNVRAAWLAS